ncbi:MAG: carboxypeptidase A2 [Chloroflexi bacterium AL-W]|nr:carboxypeptidase A2 [Chloroflexi bacterium AL-N1]NOK71485.1 carboxypeptidase A2 [Chloroflexi bacterium AL-N10]NOK77266.1 carboxypeptidase A2 [Chloroflexi bacterium AL-N5]NOK86306.1 carboxypeptidase A2 [Chloroflexi bacterium AL-W]NOK93276.1 carboxypeptidase A2 [Chloroflexi bacterium AL-N15]
MPTIDFTRYYHYDELTKALQGFAKEYQQLVQLSSIGQSHEGREIWCMAITNSATGPTDEKPTCWLDGNLHATEVTGAMGALHVIQYLLTNYGHDPAMTRLLDQRAFYIVPRVNPDGAEQYLTTGRYLRSGTRPYPYTDERDGLYPDDIDGDGKILQMRVLDPDGAWKVSAQDPRLMCRRGPDEEGGTYYRLHKEGRIRNYDGYNVKIAPPRQGLDFNRNFPYIWAPEGDQAGAGSYPASEPEIRAIVHFMTEHPNIFGAISYHTFSGAILRPFSDQPDDALPLGDLNTFKEIGQRGTALTGYPHLSVYHGFRYDPRGVMRGAFDDWAYDMRGVFAFTVELWDMIGEAGIKERDFIDWFRDHPDEDDLKLLAWNDKHLDGKGFINWRPFDHPELGLVEIGGWDERMTFGNPPPQFLLPTLEPNTDFVVALARMGPRLELRECTATRISQGVYRLHAVLVNTGYLPTYGSQKMLERKLARPIEVQLGLPAGGEIVTGEVWQEIGQLEGRNHKRGLFRPDFPTDHLCTLEWTVQAPENSEISLAAVSQLAGTVRGKVMLK